MPSFIDVVNGADAAAPTIQQVIDALKGTAGKGIPLSPTAVNDAINYALSVKNNDAGASKAIVCYKADGTVLLQIDKNGVVASADGVAAAAKVVTGNDTGTVTNAMLAGLIANAKLAADVARANQLVNGGHEIWQRWTGSPITANNAYAADRYQIILAGSDTLSVSKETTNKDTGSIAASACTFVLGTGAGATRYSQVLKTSDGYQLAGKVISLSCRRRTATANAVRVAITTDGTGGTTTYSGYHTGGGTYETLTVPNITVPADATTVTISTYFAASCTAYLDNDSLVPLSVAADYVALPPADDLARCQRYYQTPFVGQGGIGSTAQGAGTNTMRAYVSVSPQMSVVPTLTKVGTWTLSNCASQPAPDNPTVNSFRFVLGPGTAAGDYFATPPIAPGGISLEANP